jgi:hypothetical protein
MIAPPTCFIDLVVSQHAPQLQLCKPLRVDGDGHQDQPHEQILRHGTPASWHTGTIKETMTPLAKDFEPGPFDVICTRQLKAKSHHGNLFFQALIEQYSAQYAKAKGKLDRSLIVSEIIDRVRSKSPNGGFIKPSADGKWWEAGDFSARKKVGQSMRDLLHSQYRSSANSKKRRRTETNAKMLEDLDAFVGMNSYAASRMQWLTDAIETDKGAIASDHDLVTMMTQANCDISELKQDEIVQTLLLQQAAPPAHLD